jgi:hypothetical protein
VQVLMDKLLAFDLGTPLYGRFGNGRVEHFLPGRSLSPDDMLDAEISPLIAATVAQLHQVLWGLASVFAVSSYTMKRTNSPPLTN